jgi:endonuclease/exonuclease/phosphatase family metal-dependent hydrolase
MRFMKIISLNTWGGRLENECFDFIKNNKDIDIFCLQEVYFDAQGKEYDADFQDGSFNMFSDLEKILPEYNSFFNAYIGDFYGLAIFIKKDFKILEQGELFVYKHRVLAHSISGNNPRNIQYIKLKDKTIINFHGLWNGMGKGDTDDRILQSQNILDFIKTLQGGIVLCGDFNLLPETKSLKMFEEFGLINLIEEYNIQSTRTSYYTKPGKFADYAFVSKGVKVEDFKVLPDEVSDHSALYLEIK